MKGLIYKDLKLLQHSFKILPLMVVFFLLLSLVNESNSFWSVYGIFLICTMVSTMQNSDETGKWCSYCDTLPITRRDLVKEKFLFSLLVIGSTILIYICMRVIAGFFGVGEGMRNLGVTCLSMSMIGIISSSLTLTTSFLFGPQKGQIARVIVLVVMVACCMGIITYAPSVMAMLATLPGAVLLICGILIPLLIAWLCYIISCNGFAKRILV